MIDDIKRIAGPFTTAGQTQLPFSFTIFEPTDVYVATATSPLEPATNLVFGSDYTVTMNADQTATPGGFVTLTTAIADGQAVVIGSAIPYNQTTQLTNFSRFPPEIINRALDRIVVQTQQLKEELTRAVKVPSTSADTPEQLAKNLFDARDRAETAYANAAASASASASSAATSKSYADKVTDFKDQILTVADNIADVQTTADNAPAIKGIGENLTEVLRSSQYAADAKHWAEQANAIAASEAVIATGSTTARSLPDRFSDTINVKDFGAKGDSKTDDTQSFALAMAVASKLGGKTVFVPSGSYLIRGYEGSLGLNGVVIPQGSAVDMIGEGPATKLLAGSDNLILVRCATERSKVSGLAFNNNGRVGVTALGLLGGDGEGTKKQSYNRFDNLTFFNFEKALSLRCDGAGGQCFYNSFRDISIIGGGTGLTLENPSGGRWGCHRNFFDNVTVVNGENGLVINAGGTNYFGHCCFENLSGTAIYIDQYSSTNEFNGYNGFVDCKFENCTNDVIDNSYTNYYVGCFNFSSKSKYNNDRLLRGFEILIPNDPTVSFYSAPPFLVRRNDGIPDDLKGLVGYGATQIDEFYNAGHGYKSFPITVSNTENITEIAGSNSYYACANNYVDWSVRVCFCAAESDSRLAFTLPVQAHSNAYAVWSYSPGFIFPVVATAIVNGSNNVTFTCFAKIDSSSENLGLRILVILPTGCAWFTNGPYNQLYMSIRYRRQ